MDTAHLPASSGAEPGTSLRDLPSPGSLGPQRTPAISGSLQPLSDGCIHAGPIAEHEDSTWASGHHRTLDPPRRAAPGPEILRRDLATKYEHSYGATDREPKGKSIPRFPTVLHVACSRPKGPSSECWCKWAFAVFFLPTRPTGSCRSLQGLGQGRLDAEASMRWRAEDSIRRLRRVTQAAPIFRFLFLLLTTKTRVQK